MTGFQVRGVQFLDDGGLLIEYLEAGDVRVAVRQCALAVPPGMDDGVDVLLEELADVVERTLKAALDDFEDQAPQLLDEGGPGYDNPLERGEVR